MTSGQNWYWATSVGGKSSHHSTIPASLPVNIQGYIYSKSYQSYLNVTQNELADIFFATFDVSVELEWKTFLLVKNISVTEIFFTVCNKKRLFFLQVYARSFCELESFFSLKVLKPRCTSSVLLQITAAKDII